VNPSCGGVLCETVTKRQLAAKGSLANALIQFFDKSREDASLEVTWRRRLCQDKAKRERKPGASGEKDVVRMPGDTTDSRLVLLDMARNPPVVVLLEETY
jgi:hypothetical protein